MIEDDRERWAGTVMWGLMVPTILTCLALRLWLLDYALVGEFHARITFDTLRTTLGTLCAVGCVAIASTHLARKRLHFLIVLAFWSATMATLLILETAGTLFAAETGAALDVNVLVLGFAPGIGTLIVASTPSVFQMAALIALGVTAIAPLASLWRPPPRARPQWSARRWLAASVLFAVMATLPVAKGPDARVATAKSPVAALSTGAIRGLVGLGQVAGGPVTTREQGKVSRLADKPKNIVIVLLESTRRDATTPYRPDRNNTPVLAALARESVVARNAFVPLPSTLKAIVATVCGIYPDPTRQFTAAARHPPQRCLPDILEEVGYSTMFTQPVMGVFEFYDAAIRNIGFDHAVHLEDMDTTGFTQMNYLGYDERIMLAPTEAWIAERKGEPFLLTMLTVTSHHDYTLPPELVGDWHEDELANRYLSTVAVVDAFLGEFIEMLRRQGVWDNTVLVVLGDHGEAFGEHHVMQHNTVLYNEALAIPMLVRAPGLAPGEIEHPVSQLDVLQTVLPLAGLKLEAGAYDGVDMFAATAQRQLTIYCLFEGQCMGTIDWPYKYIYNFELRDHELFDLAADPREQHNIIAEHPEIAERLRLHVAEEFMRIRREYGAKYVLDPR